MNNASCASKLSPPRLALKLFARSFHRNQSLELVFSLAFFSSYTSAHRPRWNSSKFLTALYCMQRASIARPHTITVSRLHDLILREGTGRKISSCFRFPISITFAFSTFFWCSFMFALPYFLKKIIFAAYPLREDVYF